MGSNPTLSASSPYLQVNRVSLEDKAEAPELSGASFTATVLQPDQLRASSIAPAVAPPMLGRTCELVSSVIDIQYPIYKLSQFRFHARPGDGVLEMRLERMTMSPTSRDTQGPKVQGEFC